MPPTPPPSLSSPPSPLRPPPLHVTYVALKAPSLRPSPHSPLPPSHPVLRAGDLGGCEGSQLMRIRNLTSRCTWLTPWGLTRKLPNVWWPGCHRPGIDIVIPIPAQVGGPGSRGQGCY